MSESIAAARLRVSRLRGEVDALELAVRSRNYDCDRVDLDEARLKLQRAKRELGEREAEARLA